MRTILDVKTNQVQDLTPPQQERINKVLDKLGVPENGTVQLNIGKVLETAEEK